MLILLPAVARVAVADTGLSGAPSDPFDAGVDLTRQGRFDEALARFLQARSQGDHSARLDYDLGVVYYRLGRLAEATDAFRRAAEDPETRDLAHYNLGLVAMAAGEDDAATMWFRRVETEAAQPGLKALASAALNRATLISQVDRRGSLTVVRGLDSDVVLPVGSLADVGSSVQDRYWEVRAGWGDRLLEDEPALDYHLSAVGDWYDHVDDANVGVAEAGIDWRGPVLIDVTANLTTVGDRGYLRGLEARMVAAPYMGRHLRLSVELGAAGVQALTHRAEGLEGTETSVGVSADTTLIGVRCTLIARRSYNERADRELSPVQDSAALRLRYSYADWSVRAWGRWTDSDYPLERHDRTLEAGLGLGWSLSDSWEAVLEGTRLRNHSSIDIFSYSSNRIYGGLRLHF